jgi:uncharacterized protein (TIGR02246 family)
MTQIRADLDHSGFRGLAPSPGSPQKLVLDFIAALNREDLDAATSCFARDACFLTPDATAIRRRDSIRSFLAQLIASEHRFEADLGTTVIAGDVALCRDRLRTVSAAATGVPFEQHSQSTAVLSHREGNWRLQVFAPWETRWRP